MKKTLIILGLMLLSSCFGNNRKVAGRLDSTETESSTYEEYEEYEEYDVEDEEEWVHYHDADCVSLSCEDDYFYKIIHITNICDEPIKKVEIKYISIPENAYKPGVNSFWIYNLSPGETDTHRFSCNGYEVSIIVQDIIVE